MYSTLNETLKIARPLLLKKRKRPLNGRLWVFLASRLLQQATQALHHLLLLLLRQRRQRRERLWLVHSQLRHHLAVQLDISLAVGSKVRCEPGSNGKERALGKLKWARNTPVRGHAQSGCKRCHARARRR